MLSPGRAALHLPLPRNRAFAQKAPCRQNLIWRVRSLWRVSPAGAFALAEAPNARKKFDEAPCRYFYPKCRHCNSGRSKCSVVFAIRRLRWGPKLRLRYFPAMFGRSQFPKRVLCPKLDISPACASPSPLDAAPQSQKVLSWFAQKSPDALRCDWGDIRQPTAAAALAPQRPKHTSCFSLAALNCRRPHCAAAHRLAIIHCGLMSAPTPVGGTSGDGD